MATLRLDPRTDHWSVRFYWNGQQHQRSCRTRRKAIAIRTLARIEETLEDLSRQKVVMPPNLNQALQIDWIVAGGRLEITKGNKKSERNGDKQVSDETLVATLGEVCEAYLTDQSQKAATTIAGEQVHIKHLKRILGSRTRLEQIDLAAVRRYKERRKREQHHGNFTSESTIKKELVTFRQIWMWAKLSNLVAEDCPLVTETGRWKIQFHKPSEREKFRTWAEIERRVQRGGLTDAQINELWRGLYLDQTQVSELLEHVQRNARHRFIYPMFAFAAYTGARRSELVRSRVDDFQLETNQVLIRERKRRKDRSGTTRIVPLHPRLRKIIEEWLDVHPGGPYTIQSPRLMPMRKPIEDFKGLTVDAAHWHFEATLSWSKWSVVNGFHVLRHSFGSNLIRSGKVPSDVVAKWMGHTSMEMRELYQHLFPQDGLDQISVLE